MSEPLSSSGEQRREEILRQLQRAASQRRRRRLALRGASAAALVVVIAFAVHRHQPQSAPTRNEIVVRKVAPAIVENPPLIEEIKTDPTIASRWAISDDELLRELSDAGEPAGIIKMQGEATLVMSPPAPDAPSSQ